MNVDVVPKGVLARAQLPDFATATVVSVVEMVPSFAMALPVQKKVKYLCCVNLLGGVLVEVDSNQCYLAALGPRSASRSGAIAD